MATMQATYTSANGVQNQLLASNLNSDIHANAALSSDAAMLACTNVGQVGIAQNYRRNYAKTSLQNNVPLFDWLMTTNLSGVIRSTVTDGNIGIHLNPKLGTNGEYVIPLPWSYYTLPFPDTQGECCWVPPSIAKCGGEMPLELLCMRCCEDIKERIVNGIVSGGTNDLLGYFQRQGETITQARNRLIRLSMAYLTARNVILGLPDAGTATLKPFYGLLNVLQNPAVPAIDGSNILAAMETIACRRAVAEWGNNVVIALHPLTYMGIESKLVLDGNGMLPRGWSRNTQNGTFSFSLNGSNVRFIQDKIVPVDIANGTGDAWLLDGDVVGAWLAAPVTGSENLHFTDGDFNNNPDDNCLTLCEYWYNMGGVGATEYNRLAVISNIPLSNACNGDALQGLDGVIYQQDPTIALIPQI